MSPKQASHKKESSRPDPTTPQGAAALDLTTPAGAAAMEEFGFDVVQLDQVGAPTPGRIADRVSDIAHKLERLPVATRSDFIEVTKELRRLILALDAWDAAMHHLWDVRKGKVRKPRPARSR